MVQQASTSCERGASWHVCSACLPTLASLARFGLLGHSLGLLGRLVIFGHNVAVWTDWEVPFLAFRRNARYQGQFSQGPNRDISTPVHLRLLFGCCRQPEDVPKARERERERRERFVLTGRVLDFVVTSFPVRARRTEQKQSA